MSNTWRDDGFYGLPWVRVAGPIGAALYQAAEDYAHRNITGGRIPRSELRIILPWDISDADFEGAMGRLVGLGRFEEDGSDVFLPRYFEEQEHDEAQKSKRAQRVIAGRARAAKGQRDSSGRLVGSSESLAAAGPPPASVPSVRPIRPEDSVPSVSTPSERVAPASPPTTGPDLGLRRDAIERNASMLPAPVDPEPEPANESPQEMAMRFMLSPSTRKDAGQDRVWRFYAVRFILETGGKPTYPKKSGDLRLFADLLRTHGVEEFCRRVSIFFDSPPWKLRDGARDFPRFLANFDLLAVGSGDRSKNEAGDRVHVFLFEMRERLAAMNGNAPALSPEFAAWIQPTPREDEHASLESH